MKRKHLNLLLGVVALALLATVFLTRKKPEPEGAPLTALTREAVTRIVLAHPGIPDIVLEKAASQWSLTAPVKVEADAFEIGTLLSFANTETRSTLDSADLNRGELGLDPPKYSLKLDDTLLLFGEVEPLKYTRYVEVKDAAGDRVVTIDDIAGTATDADYTDLVSKALLPDGAQIASIEVPGLSVMKAAEGPGWTSIPADAAKNSDAIQKFVDAWREARSLYNQKPPADEKEKPAAVPAVATVKLADGTALSFKIIAQAPQLVLERVDLGVRYTLAAPEAAALLGIAADKKPEPASPAAPAPANPAPTTPTPSGQ
jgi:hypothetical protein